MKFKYNDLVKFNTELPNLKNKMGRFISYLPSERTCKVRVGKIDWYLEDDSLLKLAESLCKTCKQADVTCPIYPQDTLTCVEYVKKEEESRMGYKVGDNAKIVAKTYGHRFDIGALVKIIEIDDRAYNATNGMETWYVTDDEIKPVTESSPEIAPCENTDCVSDCSNCGCSHPSDEIINEMITDEVNKASHYNFTYKGVKLDPYRIFDVYKIGNPAQQHAIKKLLRAGQSLKSLKQDIEETVITLNRWLEMLEEDTNEPK